MGNKTAVKSSEEVIQTSTGSDAAEASISTSSPIASSSTTTSAAHVASTSTSAPASGSGSGKPLIKHLILDAGPILSLTPLRYLAENLYTTPAVIKELRDPKAREYLERIKAGMEGVELKVVNPGGEAMARVIAFAKKTGDYAVLSSTDLGVIALTLQYEIKENGSEGVRLEPGSKGKGPAVVKQKQTQQVSTVQENVEQNGEGDVAEEQLEEEEDVLDAEEEEEIDEEDTEEAPVEDEQSADIIPSSSAPTANSTTESPAIQINDLTLSDPPSISSPLTASKSSTTAPEEEDADSDAGEWITPSNVSVHRSRDLGHLPEGGKSSTKEITSACMTGDFAVQNVLLAMALGLVGEGGKRIGKVKSWVLRCHACFKTCKDPSKKFCPSCGNPTLLRTSTTTTSNGKTHLHLKKNYQYNLRGSKFTIPDAKPGRAKGQLKGGTGLILREDQREWTDAVKMEEGRKGKEEKKMLKGWDDPDWMPEIITVGMSGKGRMGAHGLPIIGHGRKNPNIAKKKR